MPCLQTLFLLAGWLMLEPRGCHRCNANRLGGNYAYMHDTPHCFSLQLYKKTFLSEDAGKCEASFCERQGQAKPFKNHLNRAVVCRKGLGWLSRCLLSWCASTHQRRLHPCLFQSQVGHPLRYLHCVESKSRTDILLVRSTDLVKACCPILLWHAGVHAMCCCCCLDCCESCFPMRLGHIPARRLIGYNMPCSLQARFNWLWAVAEAYRCPLARTVPEVDRPLDSACFKEMEVLQAAVVNVLPDEGWGPEFDNPCDAFDKDEGRGQLLWSTKWGGVIPGAHVKNQLHAGGTSMSHRSFPANGSWATSDARVWIYVVSVSGLCSLKSLNKSCHLGVFSVCRKPCWLIFHVTLKKVGGLARVPGKKAKTSLQSLCLGSHMNWCL